MINTDSLILNNNILFLLLFSIFAEDQCLPCTPIMMISLNRLFSIQDINRLAMSRKLMIAVGAYTTQFFPGKPFIKYYR